VVTRHLNRLWRRTEKLDALCLDQQVITKALPV
jgi:hypothetical protein